MTKYNGFCTKCQLKVPLSSNKYSYILHVTENRHPFQNLDLGFQGLCHNLTDTSLDAFMNI